jgi:hypothetical protein
MDAIRLEDSEELVPDDDDELQFHVKRRRTDDAPSEQEEPSEASQEKVCRFLRVLVTEA